MECLLAALGIGNSASFVLGQLSYIGQLFFVCRTASVEISFQRLETYVLWRYAWWGNCTNQWYVLKLRFRKTKTFIILLGVTTRNLVLGNFYISFMWFQKILSPLSYLLTVHLSDWMSELGSCANYVYNICVSWFLFFIGDFPKKLMLVFWNFNASITTSINNCNST